MTSVSPSSIDTVLAASFPAYPGLGDNVSFIAIGFGFVVFVLALLAMVTSAIGAGMKRAERRAESAKAATAPATPAPTAPAPAPAGAGPFDGHSNPEHIPAVIAAAIHVALKGRRHRIRGVRPANEGRWAQEGRRDIFSSHRIR